LWIQLFDPHTARIKMTRRPQLRDQSVLIPSIGGSKWRAGHWWSHDRVDLSLWSPQFGDQNDAKTHFCRIRLFWSPALGDQSVAQATFDPMILWVLWFDPEKSWIKITRRPQQRDQNVLIPSIGGSKCRAVHFWSHDLVDLMVWSSQFGNEKDAKATAAGSEWFEPQH
jgi:hypothetical protein